MTTEKLTPTQHKRRLLFKHSMECIWCGFVFLHPDDATLEHLLPKRFGGTDGMHNLALSCAICNYMRGHWYLRIYGPRNSPEVDEYVSRIRERNRRMEKQRRIIGPTAKKENKT